MPRVILTKSDRPSKKWMVILPNGKKVHFGAVGYEDYTQHKDKERQQRYIKRHEANEDWGDWETAGFWSRWLLWSSPSLRDAIKHIKHKFNIHIYKVRKVDDGQ